MMEGDPSNHLGVAKELRYMRLLTHLLQKAEFLIEFHHIYHIYHICLPRVLVQVIEYPKVSKSGMVSNFSNPKTGPNINASTVPFRESVRGAVPDGASCRGRAHPQHRSIQFDPILSMDFRPAMSQNNQNMPN